MPITNAGTSWCEQEHGDLHRGIGPAQSAVDHPAHYGGKDDPYEAIKVIEAWGLGFNLGNLAKYVARAGKKGDAIEDLEKGRWYLDREIAKLKAARDAAEPF